VLWAWGHGGVEVWRSGAGEACCGPGDVEARGDVEVWSSGALDARCRCCLKRGMEISSSRSMLRALGRGGVDVWTSGAQEACCRLGDVEV